MKPYKKSLLMIFLWMAFAFAGASQTPQEAYISEYSALAVKEMRRSGIPASITLAQGMLESGNGLSTLAVKGNNHFGIKCHNDWTGARIYHDDDKKGECFRKYTHPEQSYRDHSDFLRYRDRYSFLFDLEITDYKGWAYGLKQAGYATDPYYPSKLIRLIENYRLYEYDVLSSASKSKSRPEYKSPDIPEAVLPPSRIGQPEIIDESRQRQFFNVSLSRRMYSMNGVPFITSEEGETYASIADSYGLFVKELLKFNDLKEADTLLPGTVVYLQVKKNKAVKGRDKHIMEEGETLRDVAQHYAVRLKSLYKLNGIDESYVPREGDVLKLRK